MAPSAPGTPVRHVVDEVNARFRSGQPSSNLSLAGV